MKVTVIKQMKIPQVLQQIWNSENNKITPNSSYSVINNIATEIYQNSQIEKLKLVQGLIQQQSNELIQWNQKCDSMDTYFERVQNNMNILQQNVRIIEEAIIPVKKESVQTRFPNKQLQVQLRK
ncbi:Hypothetical_protein [Hexamita inflata]|uniref:Hypothetical_protein n=1 Tax=Hexamita inflata TaxID=28002 RepID=A0AA86UC28_9EUKA|nr:Hypothetical protein HINF_LOCUS34096 [Hexamita inflata]